MPKQKAETWKWCSKYIRLRDALDYCKRMGIDVKQFTRVEDLPVKCCTCREIKSWIRMDAGHFISRGQGGSSGVYFDERNINAQCKTCNAFKQGAGSAYHEFMLDRYNQGTIDQLHWFDKNQTYKYKLEGLEIYFKQEYKKMVAEIKK